MLNAPSIEAQLERLGVWEEQLQEYSNILTDDGWKSWKKGAVAELMCELQRKVVPNHWSDYIAEGEQRLVEIGDQTAPSPTGLPYGPAYRPTSPHSFILLLVCVCSGAAESQRGQGACTSCTHRRSREGSWLCS